MVMRPVTSWGRVLWPMQELASLPNGDASLLRLDDIGFDASDVARTGARRSMLPRGNGRSYGDCNLNPGGILLEMQQFNRVMEFDPDGGVLTCEAGLLLSDLLQLFVPRGWFLPVTPGTQFVTVGGAIANDVHGKNHHRAGSFGNHVLQFELLRSDGSRRVCSPMQHSDWYEATIGGLGLTGLITWARVQLRRIANPCIDAETIRFRSLEEFFDISMASDQSHEHTVSWIDCASSGQGLARGIFNRGNHAPRAEGGEPVAHRLSPEAMSLPWRVPFTPPFSLINPLSLKAFNWAYFHLRRGDRKCSVQHYRPFFYPLDAVQEWNRIYGPKGFYQYQCVLPPAHALPGIRTMLNTIALSGMGSFLAVLKQFGAPASRGMLSFPMPGTTLALDFPNRGARLHHLFEALDGIVLDAGGRLYPAKDGRMSEAVFKAGYPRWQEFAAYVDPSFSSAFWRRVMGTD